MHGQKGASQAAYHFWLQFLHTRNAQETHAQNYLALQNSYCLYDTRFSVSLAPG